MAVEDRIPASSTRPTASARQRPSVIETLWRLTRDPRDESRVAAGLVARIGAGDSKAEACLVRRYSPRIRRILDRLCADPGQAEDLHQETFGVALLRLRSRGIDRPSRLGAFLCQTARNLVIAERRKYARRKTYQDTAALAGAVEVRTGPLEQLERRQRADHMWTLVRTLRHGRDRELLYRTYLLEEPAETICLDLGIRRQDLRRLLYRARRRLETALRRDAKRQALPTHRVLVSS